MNKLAQIQAVKHTVILLGYDQEINFFLAFFSPAGPIWSTSIFLSPSSFTMALCDSPVDIPHNCPASRISAWPSCTHKYTGQLARPLTIIASNPENFSLAGQNPPACESPIAPVRGYFALTATLLCPEIETLHYSSSHFGVRAGQYKFRNLYIVRLSRHVS